MAINTYFSNGSRSEQRLYEDILIESIKMHGHNVYYIPRKIVKGDVILNEDVISKFDDAFVIEMYLDTVDSYEGDGKFISKFGLEFRDQIGLVCARRRWNQLISKFGYTENATVPREGDLIYFPMIKTLFEIKYSDSEKVFWQLRDIPTIRLTCEAFEYRDQELNTGITAIDNLEAGLARTTQLQLLDVPIDPATEPSLNSETRNLVLNEEITLTLPSGITGSSSVLALSIEDGSEIVRCSIGSPTFNDGSDHSISPGTIIFGSKSGRYSQVISEYDLDGTVDVFENDSSAQNSEFESEGNSFIDFTENNPFGEPNSL